jgi:DNA-binding NarL/FixJ family response regulator
MSSDTNEQHPMFRILIVEDNLVFRGFLRETLRAGLPFIEVAEARRGDDVLRQVQENTPDLIFMDIRLPGVSGLALTKQIKASHPSVVIAVITNYDQPEYRQAAYRHGAKHFLSKKSLSAKDMIAIVESEFAEKHPHVWAQKKLRRPAAKQASRTDPKPGPAPLRGTPKRHTRKRRTRPGGPKQPS